MDIGLRNALLAKAALQGKRLNSRTLSQIAVEEAISTLKNNPNPGYHSIKVIFSRALKIYRNLLKHYNIKQLKILGGYQFTVQYNRRFRQVDETWKKSHVIKTLVLSDAGYIFKAVKRGMYESSHT